MKREFSAGGIIFNNQGQVLLICNASLADPNKSYWGFPKGHLEEGESSKQAAIREVQEEVGIKADIICKVDVSKYVFKWGEEKVFKSVTFFLMHAQTEQIKIQENEVSEASWFDTEEAQQKLSFSNDRAQLKKALELRNGQ